MKTAMIPWARNLPILLSVVAALMLCAPVSAQLVGQNSAQTQYADIRIVPGATGIAPGGRLDLAFEHRVADGWHIFWINPGDAGLPLSLSWTMPEGYSAAGIDHPTPRYIPVGPLASYAHEGQPIFLTSITAPETATAGEMVDVTVDAFWQTCEEICVPEEASFSFSLPVLDADDIRPVNQSLFERARAAMPTAAITDATFQQNGKTFIVRTPVPGDFTDRSAFFFAAKEGLVEPSAPQAVTLEGDRAEVSLKPGYLDPPVDGSISGVLTYKSARDEAQSQWIEATVMEPILPLRSDRAPQLAGTQATNVGTLLLLAFFGGMLLNFMPCVFPVVFIKAASLMKNAGNDAGATRRDGLFYTAGVMTTLIGLGAMLLALRAGGEQLGWGFHLQSPPIVALSGYILFAVGLNLFGFFHVETGLGGTGDALTRKGGGVGAFFTGLLAVVVAAPCIGPLLAAPIGAALLLPPASGLAIFALLGLGLAMPYLALTFVPRLGELLPTPGPWMVIMKQALAFPVFAAAAYFVWVFAQQTDGSALGWMLAGGVLLALAAWLYEHSKSDGTLALIMRAVSALVVVAALVPVLRAEPVEVSKSTGDRYGALDSEPYSADALADYQRAGVPVFIDFTAAWCVTCQFDKLNIFSNDEVARVFEAREAVFMVADWTVRDPAITEKLNEFGASGVPLYLYYPAGGDPVIFDIPLTRAAVIKEMSM